jgi:hypothetical protein
MISTSFKVLTRINKKLTEEGEYIRMIKYIFVWEVYFLL